MDIHPSGTIGSYPANFTHRLGKIFFTATNDANGRELWVIDIPVSDGSELSDINELAVFPNPATNYLTIKHSKNSTPENIQSVTVIDLTGREVYSSKSADSNNSQIKHIDISQLSPGIYGVMIKTSDNSYFRKFIKE